MSRAEIRRIDDRYQVSGELTFTTVTRLLDQSRGLFAQAGETLDITLETVERADSAGLALLIEWMRTARALGKTIRFFNLPEQLMAIASASDLESILPLSGVKGESS